MLQHGIDAKLRVEIWFERQCTLPLEAPVSIMTISFDWLILTFVVWIYVRMAGAMDVEAEARYVILVIKLAETTPFLCGS
jgi:hypothetical protein